MRITFSPSLLIAASALSAIVTPGLAAPVQHHAAKPDALQSQLIARVGTVDAKLAAARKSGTVSAREAATLRKRIASIRVDSARYARKQGFLSAGESASYNRTLDEIEAKLAG